jgi:hypothetical protein
MKPVLFCLIASLILTGCSGIAKERVAFAYQETEPPVSTMPAAFPTEVKVLRQASPTQVNIPENTAEPTQATAPSPTPTDKDFVYGYGPYYFPKNINPLTGLPVENSEILERRPIVIKVTNFPRSVRPQYGLSLADNVFEYYIGDGMSRFIGVFYGQDASQVGPIRSARLFDEHIMRMYEGIFIFGWADDPVLEFILADDIKSHVVVERGDNCPPLCRIGPKGAYNNLYADTAAIGPYLSERGTSNDRQKLWGLRFEVAVPKSGNPGSLFYTEYSAASFNYWEYDPQTGRYLRYQDVIDALGTTEKEYAPLTDSLTGNQLAADNVVVLKVPHTFYYKSSSTEILDQRLTDGGMGYAFRNGYVYPITWSQDKPNQLLNLKLPNGATYPLKPGTVWFEVIGETSEFEPVADGVYHFTFNIP